MRLWHLRNEIWQLPPQGGIMGILNVTPDSFSDGGQHTTAAAALEHAECMLHEGAHIIDIGGESTRPGSSPVPEDEEMRRVLPVITAIRERHPAARISIDTRHATVAAAALQAGADIVNDISGLADARMRALCAERPCGIILMHMQGTPATMQQAPHYQDVVAEVRDFFAERVAQAEQSGIDPQRICLDPGIGFGKTTEHNLALIRHLSELRVHDLPLMMALSRKRFIGELLHNPELAKTSPLPTVALSLLAADRGADLHRVHDIAPLHHALALRHSLS
ncbi:MAG: dihydropteroate synthase [Akkermansia sp.]|nr:dihydropteroate synthase [Akkermansia sp.]